MRFSENEMVFFNSITSGAHVPELELHFTCSGEHKEEVKNTLIGLINKGVLADETRLKEEGVLAAKAFEDYKLANRHVVINNLRIAVTPVDSVVIIPFDKHEFELTRMPGTVIMMALLKQYDILREGSYNYPTDVSFVSVEKLLLHEIVDRDKAIRVKEIADNQINSDCIYYWTECEVYKYDLQMQVKKAIDPVVIRHDIAKMLRLEEERGDGQQYGKWNNRLV